MAMHESARRRRALLIAFHYPPSTSVGTQRTLRFQRYLPEFGWAVDVLAPADVELAASRQNDCAVVRAPVWRPLRRLVQWRRALTGRRRTKAGVVATAPPNSGYDRRPRAAGLGDSVRALVEFPDEQVGWYPRAVVAGCRHVRATSPDVIYSSGPPHSSHLIAWSLQRLTRLPWVADFRDPWSRRPWMAAEEKVGSRYRALVRLERAIVTAADRVVLNTPAMRADFVAHYRDLPPSKFVTISNGYDPELVGSLPVRSTAGGPPFVFTHAGSLYRRRDPAPLLEAVARLADRGVLRPGRFVLRLVGFVDPQFDVRAMIESKSLSGYVELTGVVSHACSLEHLSASHGLVLLQPGTALQVPGKLFEYLAFRRPILTLAPRGATTDIVERHRLGVVADPEDPEEIAAVLADLLTRFERGEGLTTEPAGAMAEYDGRRLTGVLAGLFEDVTQ